MRFCFSRMILTIIIGTLLTGFISAQNIQKLSLDECIQVGLENSRGIHTAKMKVVSADAKIDEINSQMLPSLNFNAIYTRLSKINPYAITTPFGTFYLTQNIPNNYRLQLTLSQPVFTGFRLSSTHKIAELNSLASREDLSQTEQQLILNIKNFYWSLFKANKIKEVVDENVGQIKAHLKDGENLFDQGLATKNDVLKVKVQLAEAQLRQIDAQNSVKLAMTNLANIIEIPLTTEIQVQDTVTAKLETIEDLEILKEKAAGNRPELKAMDYRVKAGETGIDIAQSGWFPQIYLNGNYHYDNPNQRYFPIQEKFKNSWDVNVTLSFDIWNWNKTGSQTEQAKADFEQAKDSYKLLNDAVALQVTQSYLNLVQAKEKLSVSEFSVEQAEENYRVTSELFKQGLILNSELLDVEVALLQAKTNYVQTLVDYELAKANLERAVGEKNL